MTANALVTQVVEAERARRGLTRSQLAALLGVNPMYVSRKLNGTQRWSMDDLDRISQRLGVPLPVLLMAPVTTHQGVVTRRYRLPILPRMQAA
jgi:transcriptional regulator with XRE-family HTH domain